MTEHRKIPLPQGRSLFERAEDALSAGHFELAPVPPTLGNAPALRKTVRKAVMVEETVEDRRTSPQGDAPSRPVVADAPTEFSGPRIEIDRARLRANALIEPDAPVSSLLEEFRLVKRQVLQGTSSRGGASGQRVLVSSPLPGEGKTFCTINLALAIAAERDSEVVLVDADFAKASIPDVLGFTAGQGLMDALAEPGLAVESCVSPTSVPGLFILPAGRSIAHDSEYLASARTGEVLDRLTRGAPNRIVIFDSPPALAASPASELARHVGQALVICRADRTGMSALEDTLSLLSACPDVKLLLNAANFSPSGRRFGAYYAVER